MKITPWILGSGRSAQAIAKSLACVGVMRPEFGIQPARTIPRGAGFAEAASSENPVLFIAGPHGLHARSILEAEAAGVRNIVCEKPACVDLEELSALRAVRAKVAVLHVYRQTWGPESIKSMIDRGELGEILTIEGRYWQSSTAERALQGGARSSSWKNDPSLSGHYDTLVDIGTHWLDLVSYLYGGAPERIRGWLSYRNSEAAHRDSHFQVAMDFARGGRAFGSISKTMHGATNHFEVNVLGTRLSATWNFLNPDEIVIGEGKTRRVIARRDAELGSKQPPFHGMGWLEGYIEICDRFLSAAFLGERGSYPGLQQNLDLLEKLYSAEFERGR